jgi:hypothetical protein
MDALTTILNSPLPIAISAIIAFAACAGYWFFVIPLIEESKNLRQQNKDLQDRLDSELKTHFKDNAASLEAIAVGIRNCDISDINARLSELHKILESQNVALIRSLEVNINQVQSVLGAIELQLRNAKGVDGNMKKELSDIIRLLDNISSDVDDISDKQSQVTGILTGMSIAQSINRSL